MDCGFGGKITKIGTFVVYNIPNHLRYSAMIKFSNFAVLGRFSEIWGLLGLTASTKIFYFAHISLGTQFRAKC